MNKLIEAIKREMTIRFEFYGNFPYVRLGWVWIVIIIFLGYHTFGLWLCILMTIAMIANFLNRY